MKGNGQDVALSKGIAEQMRGWCSVWPERIVVGPRNDSLGSVTVVQRSLRQRQIRVFPNLPAVPRVHPAKTKHASICWRWQVHSQGLSRITGP